VVELGLGGRVTFPRPAVINTETEHTFTVFVYFRTSPSLLGIRTIAAWCVVEDSIILITTTKRGSYDASQLEGRTMSLQSFRAVSAKFVLRMHPNYYFRASDPNSDTTTATRFARPVKRTKNIAPLLITP